MPRRSTTTYRQFVTIAYRESSIVDAVADAAAAVGESGSSSAGTGK